jgi:hypothetical protein
MDWQAEGEKNRNQKREREREVAKIEKYKKNCSHFIKISF